MQYIQQLLNTNLFQGISKEELILLLPCLKPVYKSYKKGEIILNSGDIVSSLGIVLTGGVNIEYIDFLGNTSILSHVFESEIFAETYACLENEPLVVQVRATKDSHVVFLKANNIITMCPKGCRYHNKLIENLLRVQAEKNLSLSKRIKHTSAKSIRGRLLSYLSEQAIQHQNQTFQIPFDRQQLADYLGVERSALSNELSKMEKEGMLEKKKNNFRLKEKVKL